MGYITGTPFGIGSQVINPLQQTGWGLSPYSTQAIGSHQATLLVQPIAQSLLLVAQQLQQLQQIVQFVPQQIQQLQQLLAPQATLGLPISALTGLATPALGATAFPLQTQSPFFAGQPGQVM